MENLKCLVLSGICVLLLVSGLFVRPSLSGYTLTDSELCEELSEWVKLVCALFTGVDISVHHKTPNSEIPEVAVLSMVLDLMWLKSDTIVPLLATQSFDRDLMTNVMGSQSYRYHPRLTVVIDDRNNTFFSKPGFGTDGSNGHHAESQILRFLNDRDQLNTSKYFNVSNSPCQECAREFITFFKDIPNKPTINFLWVYGKGLPPQRDENYMEAIMSLKDLKRAGFEIGLWDGMNLSKLLNDTAPTSYDNGLLQKSLAQYAKQINERAKITENAIRTIENHDISLLGLNKTDDGGGDDDDGDSDSGGDGHSYGDTAEKKDKENEGSHGILSFLVSLIFEQDHIVYMTTWFYYTRVFAAALIGWMIAFTFQRWTS